MTDDRPDQGQEANLPDGYDVQVRRLIEAGQDDEAARFCFKGITLCGDRVGLLEPLAEIFYRKGDLTRAADYLNRLCRLEPTVASRWMQLGTVLGAADRSREAVVALERAYDLDRTLAAAGVNLGITLVKLQRHVEAVGVLDDIASAEPPEPTANLWLGHALQALDRLQEAVVAYERVLEDPAMAPLAWMPLGVVFRGLGQLEQSNRWFNEVLTHQPDQPMARFALAQNQLMAGDFPSGFTNYEARWDRPGNERPRLSSPEWQGEDLSGKTILIDDEQGFGDCIQFCRLLAALKPLAAQVAFRPRKKLRALLGCLQAVDHFVDEGSECDQDFHLPLLSLPNRLGLKQSDLTGEAYLTADPALVRRWGERLEMLSGGRPMVGLVWQGDPNSQSEQGRSVPFPALLPLFEQKEFLFLLLQKQHGRDDVQAALLPDNVVDLADELDLGANAFTDTAAVMTHLTCMISSDTAPAHLAGALGVQGCILLKEVPEWRWMLQGDQSPWYGSLRLFRQQTRGDWDAPVQAVGAYLKELV
ncbi:tetratricopeptide repeat protein [Aestuariispira insulae]|uniref:Tetratricopeptide (TPR) repeat protein n=1 Tax=Aestuariispira insulae TaxID=1461337 RepID=A0A3D9HSB4_9PROT|nr:tetratricopeptide repeat protein [Aestuariispira insulae]RED52387.1 tetratricopeptide (TPR) repeat protein [Aestuariispira insulae]